MRLIIIILVFLPFVSWGSEEILRPVNTGSEPLLDGILDDEIWKNAKVVSGFKTYRPDFGMDLKNRTVVYMAYDAENIYFAFKCYDVPSLIKTSLSPRDRIEDDDWVGVNLDSFNDNQTLYGFRVNPSGIQMDTRASGGRDDSGVDFVWYSAGKIDTEGYNVEIKIPFKSIRYSNKNSLVKMGVVFERRITRESISATYPALDPNLGSNFLLQTLPIEYDGIKPNRLFELLPTVTYSKLSYMDQLEKISAKGVVDVGLTAKFGITSDLMLDVTVNPDFSQIESDVGQIDNNQRFPLFFPERRIFFQEGSENFSFSGGSGREGIRSIVNTRSISNPIVAAKLSGKLGKNNRIAAIYAKDELLVDDVDTDPYAEFAVLRYRRSFNEDTYVGGFYTTRIANGDMSSLFALDGKFRFKQNHTVEGFYLESLNKLEQGIGVDHGYANAFSYGYSSRNLSIRARMNDSSDDFKTDVGYVGRVGVTTFNLFLGPNFYFETKWLQRVENWISLTRTLDNERGLGEKSYDFSAQFRFVKNTSFSLAYNFKDEVFEALNFNRDNYRIEARSQLNKRINVSLEYRHGNLIRYVENPYSGYGSNVSAELNLQLSEKINTQWRYTFSDFYRTSDEALDFDRSLIRSRNTYQVNKYFFLRAIIEYDSGDPELTADFLASFTLIPGTVVFIGYGSTHNKMEWDQQLEDYVSTKDKYESFKNGFFFKASYLFRK